MIDTDALREKVLDLAIRGKLVPHDPNDEPASVLLERIHEQKLQMVREGKLKAKDVKYDTIIFKGDDNCYYEKFSDGTIKNIQDEIPFDLPVGWAWSRLNSICSLIADIDHKMPKSVNNGVLFLSAKDLLNDGTINYDVNVKRISEEDFSRLARKAAPQKNDIIYSRIGACLGKARVVQSDIRFLVSYSCCTIRPIIIDSTFLASILDGDFVLCQAKKETQSVGVPDLGIKNIKNFLVPISPLKEQVRIDSCLKKTFTLLDEVSYNSIKFDEITGLLKSKILELAIQGKLVPQDENDEPASVLLERIRAERKAKLGKKYVESYIYKGDDNCYYEKVGSLTKNITAEIPFDIPNLWSWIRLSNITTLITKGTTPRGDAYTYTNSGIGFLRAENIVGFDKISKKDLKYINETTNYNFLKRSILEENDILITIAGTLGRTGMVTKEDLPLNANQAVSIVRIVNGYKIDLLYLIFVLNAPIIKKYLLSKSVEMAIPNLSLENISDCVIPLPPIQEQYNITKKISQLFDMLKGGD